MDLADGKFNTLACNSRFAAVDLEFRIISNSGTFAISTGGA